MNLESLKNISGHIETTDTKEKREILFEKIEQISLVYAKQKFKEIKSERGGYKFSDAIKELTPIKNIILRPTFHLEGFDREAKQEEIDLFFDDFYHEFDSRYETEGFDLNKISDFINSKRDSIKSSLGADKLKEFDEDKECATKALSFNKITNIELDAEKKYKNLENLGFSESDQFTEIHVRDFYSTGEKNFGSELLKKDLAIVAEYIIDKQPEAVAVIGESWLLNTPVADLLGFKRIADNTTKQNDFSTWLQFIDKNGQIDQRRFNEFLKTGELPFKNTKAYMSTNDFLQKYLPENRRGKIMLKEINNERKAFWFKMQVEAQSIKTGWSDLLKNNGDFESFIKDNQTLNELLDFVSSENKAEYLSFFRTMYDKKIPWAEFAEHKSDSLKQVDEKINADMNRDLYQNKEVFI